MPWLIKQGVYQQLIHEYEKSAWVRRLGQGAYIRDGDKVEWKGGIYTLQQQLSLPIHPGGKTALELLGYGHYMPLGKGKAVQLYGEPLTKLPAWFNQHKWGVTIQYVATNLFSEIPTGGLTEKEMGSYAIRISTPERAMMEVLWAVPRRESYEGAALLMEGLTTLRPKLVQVLLEHCQSVKVKRVFMVLAESCAHTWVKKLNLSKVNFGKGKRSLVPGGQLEATYQITIPSIKDRKRRPKTSS